MNNNECFKCSVSGEKVKLYNAISNKGVVKICGDCNAVERFPIIRRATNEQIADSQKQKSVKEAMAGMNRLNTGRETSLRELVDRNLKERLAKQPSDLIDNFHWTIQRIRRNKKITREQFAKGINENESITRMLEQGILPNNDYRIITKVENYLGINLKKQGVSKFPESQQKSQPSKPQVFNRDSASRLKVADLRGMKKKVEDGGHQGYPYTNPPVKKPVDSWEGETSQDDEKFLDEIDDDFFDGD